MITTSKNANPNYLGKIVQLKGLQRHPNADRLQTINIDFQTVVTGLDAKDGDIYVYFPVECTINKDFLKFTNSFRKADLNADSNQVGFFEEHGRVQAVRLRGTPSCGYIVPLKVVEDFTGVTDLSEFMGKEFNTINGILMLEKYIPKNSQSQGAGKEKQGKKPKVSRLIEGQVHLHIDTKNLRKNIHKINPEDQISITYKTHGTSWHVSNVLVKRSLSWTEKVAKYFGVVVQETEYDLVFGSRKVIKNANMEDPKAKDRYFGYDLWLDVKDKVKDAIPKGYTLYGEALGFDKNGKAIQGGYDYGCKGSEMKLEVYRITQTNVDGFVTELTYPQIKAFCEKSNLTAAHLFYSGKAEDMYPHLTSSVDNFITEDTWRENFLTQLEKDFNEKNCFMCTQKAPEEGVVLRVENLFSCDSYKLKSFRFLEHESKELDLGITDIESEN